MESEQKKRGRPTVPHELRRSARLQLRVYSDVAEIAARVGTAAVEAAIRKIKEPNIGRNILSEIDHVIEGVISGERPAAELTAYVAPEAMPIVLNHEAKEFYRLQAIFRGAPDEHPFKQGAEERLPGMVRVIEALGGKVIPQDTGSPLTSRHWVVNADSKPITDDVVIAW